MYEATQRNPESPCLHAPAIRSALEAAGRLSGIAPVGFRHWRRLLRAATAEAWASPTGPDECIHGYGFAIPCFECDRIAVVHGMDLLRLPLSEVVECHAAVVAELRATVQGQALQLTGLLHANRELQAALDRALHNAREQITMNVLGIEVKSIDVVFDDPKSCPFCRGEEDADAE